MEEIWKKRFQSLRYVQYISPLSGSRCNNISFGLYEFPTGACWRRRPAAHQEKVLHSKVESGFVLFWKIEKRGLGVMRRGHVMQMYWRWKKTVKCYITGKKSPLAGTTWTFPHSPDVLILNCSSHFPDSNADFDQTKWNNRRHSHFEISPWAHPATPFLFPCSF